MTWFGAGDRLSFFISKMGLVIELILRVGEVLSAFSFTACGRPCARGCHLSAGLGSVLTLSPGTYIPTEKTD